VAEALPLALQMSEGATTSADKSNAGVDGRAFALCHIGEQ
jgi:hypothetical protein